MKRKGLVCIFLSIALLIPSVLFASFNDSKEKNTEGLTIVQMEKEIADFWYQWYDDQPWKKQTKIYKGIPKIAKYTAESIYKFQREPVAYNWRKDTATLPIGQDVHFVIASMATYETSLDPQQVGRLGEGGLLQCHPKWCMKTDKRLAKMTRSKRIKTVKTNTALGIELGVRFLTRNVGWCGREIERFDDWSYPVSSYGAGTKAFRNGRCIKIPTARRRIKRAKEYRTIIRTKNLLISKFLFGFRSSLV